MTQGIFTIVKNNRVLYKIITGSDGYNIDQFTKTDIENIINSETEPKRIAERLYDLAIRNDFGCREDLVVSYVDFKNYVWHIHFTDDELPELYTTTFFKPNFNPRWENGTADYSIIFII